jgi:YVTN family beta-propeller protein
MNIRKNLIFSVLLTLGLALIPSWATAAHSIVGTIPVGKKPAAVAIEPTRNLAAVINKNGTDVSILDLATLSVLSKVPVGRSPSGVAIAVNGVNHVAVSSPRNPNLTLINLSDSTIRSVAIPGKDHSDVAWTLPAISPWFLMTKTGWQCWP